MSINIPLLTDVMVHVRRHPEQHHQSFWGSRSEACGTVHCIAGWTAVLTKAHLDWQPGADPDQLVVNRVLTVSGEETVEHYARRILGLTEFQSDSIFFAGNQMVWDRVKAHTRGAITMAKIDEIIAMQDEARHRKEDEKTEDEKTTEDRESDRELVSA